MTGDIHPKALWHLWQSGQLSTNHLTPTVMATWARAGTERYTALTRPQWRQLWDTIGFRRDGQPDTPPASLAVYRGSPAQYRDNWSWTDRLDVARHYAALKDGQVWTATAPASALLAYRHTPMLDLTEWIVDTSGLEIREHVTQAMTQANA